MFNVCVKSSSHYQSIIKVLEDERDHYKREVDILKTLRSRPTSPARSPAPKDRVKSWQDPH